MQKKNLIISDVESTKNVFKSFLSDKYTISFYKSRDNAIENNEKSFFDYIFIDLIYLKKFNTKSLTKDLFNETFLPLQKHFPEAKKILMAQRSLVQDCVLAVKLGIDSYINYPLVVDEIQYVMDLIFERIKLESEIKLLKEKKSHDFFKYLTEPTSLAMKLITEKVNCVSKTNSTVLITGESGTGKSVLAKQIHDLSNRSKNKFISIHCGALQENLIESELFGHEKGSFTGAIKKKIGKFELANGGTIFLDEIGTIPESTQIRLLQVLQERFIQRVGGEVNIDVDIRIIAATNSDLQKCVAEKKFREDLYYRLNVFQIELPPLCKRCDDIKDLVEKILTKFNRLYGKEINKVDDNVIDVFKHYSWPGNIRELENLMERAYILEQSHALTAQHFPDKIFNETNTPKPTLSVDSNLSLSKARKKALAVFERNYITQLLEKTVGELKEASILAGVCVRQLHKLMAKYKINRSDFLLPSPQEDFFSKIKDPD